MTARENVKQGHLLNGVTLELLLQLTYRMPGHLFLDQMFELPFESQFSVNFMLTSPLPILKDVPKVRFCFFVLPCIVCSSALFYNLYKKFRYFSLWFYFWFITTLHVCSMIWENKSAFFTYAWKFFCYNSQCHKTDISVAQFS